jgi:CRISPR-associated protein Csm3
MNLEFKGKYLIRGKLICETGLHIGGSTEGLEIGGVDNPVIKDPLTERPYVPGSSIKGKLRHLLEWSLGPNPNTNWPHHFTEEKRRDKTEFKPCSCGKCAACQIFGVASDKPETRQEAGPTRLTVRDAFLTEKLDSHNPKRYYSCEELTQLLGDGLYTEIKTENALDRVTSEANPRPMERVPAGAAFDVEMIFDVYRLEDKELLKGLYIAMHLLEQSALGGSGSRGHGKVKFADLSAEFRPVDYYRSGDGVKEVQNLPATVKEVVKSFDSLSWHFPSFDTKGS